MSKEHDPQKLNSGEINPLRLDRSSILPKLTFTDEELDEAIAATHRNRVMNVLNINSQIIQLELENFPDSIPEIKLNGENDHASKD